MKKERWRTLCTRIEKKGEGNERIVGIDKDKWQGGCNFGWGEILISTWCKWEGENNAIRAGQGSRQKYKGGGEEGKNQNRVLTAYKKKGTKG